MRLSLSQQRDVLELFTRSARGFLDSWFESEAVKAAFGFDAVVGNYASPDTPGSAYVLLHHVFGEVNGKKGAWGHSVGGMGKITEIMAKVCRDLGVEISLEEVCARTSSVAGQGAVQFDNANLLQYEYPPDTAELAKAVNYEFEDMVMDITSNLF